MVVVERKVSNMFSLVLVSSFPFSLLLVLMLWKSLKGHIQLKAKADMCHLSREPAARDSTHRQASPASVTKFLNNFSLGEPSRKSYSSAMTERKKTPKFWAIKILWKVLLTAFDEIFCDKHENKNTPSLMLNLLWTYDIKFDDKYVPSMQKWSDRINDAAVIHNVSSPLTCLLFP